MAVLTAPPLRDQTAAHDADRFELCGESCLASALGLPIEAVVTWTRLNEGGERAVKNGTTARELIDFCHARFVEATALRGTAPEYLAAASQRGHYALVLVWSDHAGKPIPRAQSVHLHPGGIGHWLLGYGTQAGRVMVMQPWGGRLVMYSLRNGEDQRFGIEVHKAAPGAKRAPAPVKTPRPVAKPVGRGRLKIS